VRNVNPLARNPIAQSDPIRAKYFAFKRAFISKARGRLIDEARRSFGINIRLELPYGSLLRSHDGRDGTFYPSHNEGLFSCLTTFMWSIMDLYRLGQKCYIVDNSMGMNDFKQKPGTSTWYELFEKRSAVDIHNLMAQRPLTEIDPGAGSFCRRGLGQWPEYMMFDHHGNYSEVVHKQIGLSWANAFLQAYLTPSHQVREICERFDEECRISSTPTISVYYRGTDKFLEVDPTPLEDYYDVVDQHLEQRPQLEILIQTDQEQVLNSFLDRYGRKAKYIKELPVSRGSVAIHKDSSICGNRGEFAKRLYAMCEAISNSDTIVTNTGNVGFFLALLATVKQRRVVQLQ